MDAKLRRLVPNQRWVSAPLLKVSPTLVLKGPGDRHYLRVRGAGELFCGYPEPAARPDGT